MSNLAGRFLHAFFVWHICLAACPPLHGIDAYFMLLHICQRSSISKLGSCIQADCFESSGTSGPSLIHEPETKSRSFLGRCCRRRHVAALLLGGKLPIFMTCDVKEIDSTKSKVKLPETPLILAGALGGPSWPQLTTRYQWCMILFINR